jgi:hypothetical protein
VPLALFAGTMWGEVAVLRSAEAGEAVEDEAARDGDVEAGAGADHGNLDAGVGVIDVLGRDALSLVAEQDDGPFDGGL